MVLYDRQTRSGQYTDMNENPRALHASGGFHHFIEGKPDIPAGA